MVVIISRSSCIGSSHSNHRVVPVRTVASVIITVMSRSKYKRKSAKAKKVPKMNIIFPKMGDSLDHNNIALSRKLKMMWKFFIPNVFKI